MKKPAPPANRMKRSILPAQTGRREINKSQKRQRIRAAALMLFSKQGYEATTLRQIARVAQVALGTLSLYAQDKRDLILLIFNARVSDVIDCASKASLGKGDLLGQVVAFFGVFYKEFHKDLTLARMHLQLNYYSGGMHAAEYYAHRARVFALLEALVKAAREKGEISTAEDPTLIARHVFFLFSAAVRWWIAAPKPNLKAGIEDFRRLLQLQISGLGSGLDLDGNRTPVLTQNSPARPRRLFSKVLNA